MEPSFIASFLRDKAVQWAITMNPNRAVDKDGSSFAEPIKCLRAVGLVSGIFEPDK